MKLVSVIVEIAIVVLLVFIFSSCQRPQYKTALGKKKHNYYYNIQHKNQGKPVTKSFKDKYPGKSRQGHR